MENCRKGVLLSANAKHIAMHASWIAGSMRLGLVVAVYGAHTSPRTKPWLIYRCTKNLEPVRVLLWHTKLDSTVRVPHAIARKDPQHQQVKG